MHTLYGPGPEEPEPLRPVRDLQDTPVEDPDRRTVGRVYGALAEAESGLLRYLDVALEGSDRHVLVPIGHVRLERRRDRPHARLRAATARELEEIPPFEPHRTEVGGTYQRAVLAAHGRLFHGERYYAHPAFDHSGLYAGEHPIVRGSGPANAPLPLAPLSHLPGFRVAEGEPDIRGRTLLGGDGRPAGTIRDLLVDTAAAKVRYAVVLLDGGRETLLPVGFLKIENRGDTVRAPALTTADLRALPPYHPGPLTRNDEDAIRRALEERLDGDRRFQRPDFHAGATPGRTAP